MRTRVPENLCTVALSTKALQNIKKLAFPNGAVLSCSACGRQSEKTAQQMEKYLQKWPKCCGVFASVKPL